MKKLNDVYVNKVNSCITAIEAIGCSVQDILERYKNESFPEGPNKKISFEEVIKKELSDNVYEYLGVKCGLAHHRDSRESYEYGIDLMLGWLIEDAVILLMKEKGKKAILSGEDRFREFLTPRKISTQPDIKFMSQNGERMLEIFSDWKGTWRDKNHADLRDNKYAKLNQHKALMIGIAPITLEGFLVDFGKGNHGFVEGFIPAYRKQGYTCKGIRSFLQPLANVIKELLSQ